MSTIHDLRSPPGATARCAHCGAPNAYGLATREGTPYVQRFLSAIDSREVNAIDRLGLLCPACIAHHARKAQWQRFCALAYTGDRPASGEDEALLRGEAELAERRERFNWTAQAVAAQAIGAAPIACTDCADYVRTTLGWGQARQGEEIPPPHPTWDEIAGSGTLCTNGETLRKRCRRHATRGVGHEAAALSPRNLLMKAGIL